MKEDIFSFRNIYRQYINCRKRKRNTINALKFEIRLEDNILSLQEELRNRSYYPSRSVCFVAKRPKLREIFAADFRDRVVHHILVDYLEKIWEPVFIYDSYACRKGKGNHQAVKRLRSFMRKVSKNGAVRADYMQLDIHNFFVSIDKEILFNLIAKRIENEDILWLLKVLIFHDPTRDYVLKSKRRLIESVPAHKSLFNTRNKRGLPIGNLTSQFFGNVYLNELDQFVKHNLKAKYYLRYVDDFVILHRDKEQLDAWRKEIGQLLKNRLNLSLHPGKQVIRPVSNGVDFLGYIVRAGYILSRNRVVNNLKEKLNMYQRKLFSQMGGWTQARFEYPVLENVLATVSSYLAHFKMAYNRNLKNRLWERYRFLKEFFSYDGRGLRRRYGVAYDFRALAAQYAFFRHRYPGDLLFFQVGGFYEFFDRDARFVSDKLGLRMIKGRRGLRLRCRFPLALKERYLGVIMKNGGGSNITIIKEEDMCLLRIKRRMVTERWKLKVGEQDG
ncbi:MAG: reverse transcriptase domain-containing protein [Candidatus Omnitrophica bacterium]|nr:reverse transcriptase domain-containing protein [Candidatus Omnitrophota bacterium]